MLELSQTGMEDTLNFSVRSTLPDGFQHGFIGQQTIIGLNFPDIGIQTSQLQGNLETGAHRFILLPVSNLNSDTTALFSLELAASGVKSKAVKCTPGKLSLFRANVNMSASSQGAPNSSKGVAVPLPTDRFVVSSSPIPG